MTDSSFQFFSLTLIVLFPFSMATDTPLPLRAILKRKNAIAIMTLFSTDRCLDIAIEGSITHEKWRIRSQYFVRLYVTDKEVAESTPTKPRSSILKWEWSADNQM